MSKVKVIYGNNVYNGFVEIKGYFRNGKGINLSGWMCPICGVVELAQDLGGKVKWDEADGIKVKVRVPKCLKCNYTDWRKTISEMNEGGVVI